MGNLLGHAIFIKSGSAIRADDEDKLHETNKFKMLFDVEWNKRVNSILKRKKAKNDLAKMADIPFTKGIRKFPPKFPKIPNLQK